MPTVVLPARALVSVSGPDAEHLLQSILTTDLAALPEGVARPGALLTPQGKILFDFLVSRDGADGFLLECRGEIADDFMRRLMLYKLRAKLTISKRNESLVAVSWTDETSTSQPDSTPCETDSTGRRDARFPESLRVVRRPLAQGEADTDLSAWTALRIAHGVAESGSDYALADAFPHDVLLDQNGGVGLRKGCYVGQEVVSRMHHRGTARRRVLIAEADADLAEAGTPVLAQGRPAGALGSVLGAKGLAVVRIDKVKAAMDAGEPVTAGGVALRLSIPPGMGFAFPDGSAGEDA
ncbi:folate-binding protein [Aquibium carbonis]|uniref:Folate-binding protein n=1 Tax=Aquibium carbonis TaxID=2495581 RepID=A0A3R9YER3_9HYPH|nr:folate-binding protein YgfZ [Aquibium carbonis]RST85935.1 folate-binding protein [Aquibium carbonis]